MRNIIFCLMVFYTCTMMAQSELVHSSARVNMTSSTIVVEQFLELNLPDSIQSIEIKALNFEGVKLSFISAISENETLNIEEIVYEGLKYLKLSSSKVLKYISINYQVEAKNDNIQIPLFFTNLSAASSENDFFKAELKMSLNNGYTIQFPKVALNEITENEIKTTSFEVPALPSVLRIERVPDNKPMLSFLTMIDLFVALIFVIIGILIWKNRKRLIYG